MTELTFDQKLIELKSRLVSFNQNLSEEQLDFILHPIDKGCYLKACPGSGKTEVVGIKAAYEIHGWKNRYAGIAVLSFTKNAAKEISERITKHGNITSTSHPHFIGTIDSWIHGYILHPFGHKATGYKGKENDKSYRLIDNETRYDFLYSFRTIISHRPKYQEAWVNDYYFECSEALDIQSQSRGLKLDNVSQVIITDLRKNKTNFLRGGLTTYADAEFICYYLLKKNPIILNNLIRRFPIMIIDECQDLSINQLEILKLLAEKGVIIHFVGDANQSIYEFKKVYIEEINKFIETYKLFVRYLSNNYRSNQTIVNVCAELEKLNSSTSNVISGQETHLTDHCCLLWQYEESDFSQLPQRFIDFVKGVNVRIDVNSKKIDLSKSAVLARGHSTLSAFKSQTISDLSKIELFANALNCWAINPRSSKDMQNAIQQIGKSICLFLYKGNGNHQQQFCPEYYTTIDWRNLLCDLLLDASKEENGLYPLNHNWSTWAGKLKVFLNKHFGRFDSPLLEWDDVKKSIKAPSSKANEIVTVSLKTVHSQYSDKIRLTTFHDVKGETLDAVLIVSAKNKQSKGGYFAHWISTKANEKEYIRFAYVASSRPKHLLIWAIPKITNNSSLTKIEQLGFIISQ
jgi:DNA helicase-2/ATP-dependent DNA helicase PcrA